MEPEPRVLRNGDGVEVYVWFNHRYTGCKRPCDVPEDVFKLLEGGTQYEDIWQDYGTDGEAMDALFSAKSLRDAAAATV